MKNRKVPEPYKPKRLLLETLVGYVEAAQTHPLTDKHAVGGEN
jgi:hypothetical protein